MASARKKVRLAIVVSHAIQYYVPLYRRLALDPDIDLKVYYFSDLSVRGGFDEGFGGDVRWDIDRRNAVQGLQAGLGCWCCAHRRLPCECDEVTTSSCKRRFSDWLFGQITHCRPLSR